MQLLKSQMVMTMYLAFSESVKFGPSEEGEGKRPEMWISRHTWEDMGQPEEITVTIEPGDKLNSL